jgi:hypothetical protein
MVELTLKRFAVLVIWPKLYDLIRSFLLSFSCGFLAGTYLMWVLAFFILDGRTL